MTDILSIDLRKLVPSLVETLGHQGMPAHIVPDAIFTDIYDHALDLYLETASPQAVTSTVSHPDFDKIYTSATGNSDDTPLMHIYPNAFRLDLYALTLGPKISEKIVELFQENEFPLANMLDSIASLAADSAVSILEKQLSDASNRDDAAALGYSPGYCGWHISSQAALFKVLDPERIGISLNQSYLMSPIKSVSGVLITAAQEVHEFKNNFEFCRDCTHHSCLPRLQEIRKSIRSEKEND